MSTHWILKVNMDEFSEDLGWILTAACLAVGVPLLCVIGRVVVLSM